MLLNLIYDGISWVRQNDTCVSILISLLILQPRTDDLDRSKIIDNTEAQAKGPEHALAYFYCNYKEDQRRDPASILRSLIKQLCLESPGDGSSFPEPVLSVYRERKKKADLDHLLNVQESKNLLLKISAGFLRTTIVIDALDECDPDTRGTLFDVLGDLVSESSPKGNPLKAFVTSRDDGDLRAKFENTPNVYIQERDNSSDINQYIKSEIQSCIKAKRLLRGKVSVDLEGQIIRALEEGARGM